MRKYREHVCDQGDFDQLILDRLLHPLGVSFRRQRYLRGLTLHYLTIGLVQLLAD